MRPEIKKRIEQIQKGVVPEGYKKTKVGIVPGEWKAEKLLKIAKEITRKNDGEEYSVLTISSLSGFLDQGERFSKVIAGENLAKYTLLEKNEFAYNKGNSKTYPQGCIFRLEDYNKALIPNVYISFRIVEGINNYYKQYFVAGLLNHQLSRVINTGVRNDGLLNLYDKDFFACQLLCPPLPDQEKIAEILSAWDKAINLKEQLIVEKKRQKKWLMQNLLTGKRRLPGFTDEWQEVRLGDLGELARGKGVSRSNVVETGFPFISYGEIYTTHNIEIKEYRTFINSKGREECFRIYKGDIIFTGSGESAKEIGKAVVFLFDDEAYAGGDTIVLTQKCNDSLFLAYMLNSDNVINQLASLGQGNSVVHIYPFQLAQILFHLPPLPEQTAIANILSTADREIDLHEKQLEELKKQKKALMQLLLTGIVRVNAQEVS